MNNEIDLVNNIALYYPKSLTISDEFEGPSIYFHVQAIQEQKRNFLSTRHIEMIYATLASWGLHRMGDPSITKTKMINFNFFYDSIVRQGSVLNEFRNLKMDTCTEIEYREYLNRLEIVYKTLVVSISNSTLVAHSKTLAHILPDLIPPIDRQYTVRFFTQDNKYFFTKSGKYKLVDLPIDRNQQFLDFQDYCIRIKRMFDQCDPQSFEINPNTFNTSYPKIMDNLIMTYVKSVSKPNILVT